jgi:hypothetical protein
MKRWVTVGLFALYVAAHVSARESNILARLEGAIRVGPITNVVLSPNSRWTEPGVRRIVAVAQALPSRQTFPLANTNGLLAGGLTMDTAEFLGRKALRLVKRRGEGVDGFLPLPGVDFQDGTIEADVAVQITPQPGRPSPGFIGIAFRARPDASSYDMFYVRPGAAQADDQARRNQVAQYCAAPGYDWYRLRRAWPWVYEAHADLHLDAWTHMKIVVAGRTARLYLNRNPEPSLVVDGLKGVDLHGGVSLFTFVDQEGYFSNVRITHVAPEPIKNGSDAAGTWEVKLSTDAGNFDGTLQLQRDGNKLSGSWSGALGENREVTGTWRDGYVELSFTGEWPNKMRDGTPGAVTTTLAGWFDGASGKGRSKIDPRADGQWTATRRS